MSLDYEAIRAKRNATNAFARKLGLTITRLEEGYAEAVMAFSPTDLNPYGSAHGGCLFSAADVACGAAISSYGRDAATLNSSFNYLRPGLNTKLIRAKAHVVKHGKRVSVAEVSVMDENDQVLCTGVFTFMTISTNTL